MKIVQTFLILSTTTPIWLYLLYQILEKVGATELMWFLYWLYLPATFIVGLLAAILNARDLELLSKRNAE